VVKMPEEEYEEEYEDEEEMDFSSFDDDDY